MEEPRQQRQAAGHPSHIEHSAGRFGSPSLSWDCYGLRPTLSLSFHLIFQPPTIKGLHLGIAAIVDIFNLSLCSCV